jgi:hypothetical protein
MALMRKNFKLADELPKMIEKYKTLGVTELHNLILQDYNKDISTQTINMYFLRHKEVKANYEQVFSSAAVSQIEVNGEIFKNGNFDALPSIKKWVIEKTPLVSPLFLGSHIQALKRICKGIYFMKDKTTKKLTEVQIQGWTIKTPERLTLEQFQEYISHVHKAGNATNTYRIAFRDFILSRDNRTLKPSEVSGLMTTGTTHVLGRWKNVRVSKETAYQILNYVKERNFQFYAADFTAYKTGSRAEAVKQQFLESKIHYEEGSPVIDVTDKGFHRKGRQTYPKVLTPDLFAVLKECWLKYGNNPFGSIDSSKLNELNKEAYRIFLKDCYDPDGSVKEFSALEMGLESPFHFWRHLFGRAMLEATNYNYTAVAVLGSWKSEAMLKEVYGAPPMAMIRKAGLEAIPLI